MRAAPLLLLAACGGEGTWNLSIWGEAYIEEGITAEAFADGCAATFSTFQVVLADLALEDGDGAVVAEVGGARVFDLVMPGPRPIGSATVPADHYTRVRAATRPAAGATAADGVEPLAALTDGTASVHVAGELTCAGATKAFTWTFDAASTYVCEPEDLTIGAGGSDDTELTIHGDHLFYDGLTDPEAEVRGQALFDADADADGVIAQAELAAVAVAPLGYTVGPNSEVTDLAAFVATLTRSFVHIDGEGHCQVGP